MEVIKNKNKLFSKSKNLNTFISPVIFLIVFLLVFINKTDLNMISKIRGLSLDIITPISSIVAFPINKTSEFINYAYHIKNLSLENDRLKIENKRLLRWKTLSTRLIDENEAYKQLLNVQDKNLQLQQTVRILTQPSGSFINSIQLNAGKNKDIKINSSVINERGLVGRIIEVGNFSSKVLLINDMNSNIPVKVFNTDINAIITGNSDQKLRKQISSASFKLKEYILSINGIIK